MLYSIPMQEITRELTRLYDQNMILKSQNMELLERITRLQEENSELSAMLWVKMNTKQATRRKALQNI
jgi:predicted nuclease with TOPRIM domain